MVTSLKGNMEVLSDIIECSVCLERMDTKSKVLPCQHTFCSDCLHRIFIQNKNELKCPECRFICNVPVRNLPSNILLVRLLEGMKTSGNPISGKREVLREAGQPCAEALYTYDPQESGDLKFRRGDLIYLKKRLDENWFVGELNGKSGYLPATYVKVICPFAQVQSKPLPPTNNITESSNAQALSPPIKVAVRALYDFEMKEEEKEDCLKFKKDEVIQIIRRVDHNWAEGRLAGMIGIFPINYVRLTDAAKALLDGSPTRVSSSSAKRSSYNVSRSRNVSGPPSLNTAAPPVSNTTELPEVTRRVADSTSAEDSEVKMVIPSLSTSDSSARSSQPSAASSGSDGSRVRSKSSPDGAPVKMEGESQAAVNKISIHNIYRAMYDYKPQKDDELTLTRGALYHVTDRCKDGWYRGHSLRLGTTGVFPGNYVQLIPPDSEGASGDAIRTMRRGRLAPPVEKQTESGPESKDTNCDSKRSQDSQRVWAMNVMGCPAPSPKMRSGVRRNASVRDRRRSSSLSRLENQYNVVIGSGDHPPKALRGSTKPSDSTKFSKTTRMRYVCVMAYPAQSDLELNLKVGDVVVVLKKKSEGWYKGTNETSGKTGVFPACFVQSFSSSSSNESRSS